MMENNNNNESTRIMVERKKLIMDVKEFLQKLFPEGNEDTNIELLRILAKDCALILLGEVNEVNRKELINQSLSLAALYKAGLNKSDLSIEDKKEIESRIDSISAEDLNNPSIVIEKLKIDPSNEADPMEKFQESIMNMIQNHPKPEVREASGFMTYFNS